MNFFSEKQIFYKGKLLENNILEIQIQIENTYMNVIKFGTGSRNLVVIAGVSLCGLEGLGEQLEKSLGIFANDFTVYVFDRRKVLPTGYTMNEMSEDIYYCLNRLSVKKTSVYGVSQGGMIAQILSVNHPDLVENLVLCSTSAKIEKDNMAFTEWKKASQSCNVVQVNQLFINFVYSAAFRKSIEDYIPSLIKKGTFDDCQRFTILIDSMLGFDFTNQLSEIKCPLLVICDKQDKIFDYRDGKYIAEKNGGKLIVYDKYSHAVFDEAQDLKEKIAEFLK